MTAPPQTGVVEPRPPSRPQSPLPAGACDTHTHIFGPYDRFPFVHPSSYAPPLAPHETQAAMLRHVGVTRSVLVQPAPYAANPAALLDALRRSGGSARGVAVASPDVADPTLREWHEAGVRGLRFADVLDRGTGQPFLGSVSSRDFAGLAPRMKGMGWHAQLWAPITDAARTARALTDAGVPVVLEHLGMVAVEQGVSAPAFQELLALVREGRVWVKLDLCRVSRAVPGYADARPFHDALVEANPSRLFWASDWPFVRLGDDAPDVGRLLDLFCDWVTDVALRQRILVTNPAEFYGFEA